VFQLRPVTFAYRDDAQGAIHYGLNAKEVAAVYPEMVTHAPTGEVQTVRYQDLIPLLLNELQRQHRDTQQQQQAIEWQQRKLAELRTLLEQRRRQGSAIERQQGERGELRAIWRSAPMSAGMH
jgi:hypothetical protein